MFSSLARRVKITPAPNTEKLLPLRNEHSFEIKIINFEMTVRFDLAIKTNRNRKTIRKNYGYSKIYKQIFEISERKICKTSILL